MPVRVDAELPRLGLVDVLFAPFDLDETSDGPDVLDYDDCLGVAGAGAALGELAVREAVGEDDKGNRGDRLEKVVLPRIVVLDAVLAVVEPEVHGDHGDITRVHVAQTVDP